MEYFENSSKRLNPRTLQRFIINHVSSVELKAKATVRNAPDLQFGTNEEFWMNIIDNSRMPRLHYVSLHGFRVSNWYPRVPGIHHTTNGVRLRAEAKSYIMSNLNDVFYSPHGKSRMVKGGTGSVKFQPVRHEGDLFWLCTATSDSYCHTGIPLFIPNAIYENIDSDGLFEYSITGSTRFLPDVIERQFGHYRGMPKLYIQVESIKKTGKPKFIQPLLVTPVVYFKSTESEEESRSEDLVTFAVCDGGRKYNPDEVFDWFLNYTGMYNGRIMTNFDEQCPLFEDVPFSLQKVMREEIFIRQVETLIVQSPITQMRVKNMNSNNNNISFGDGNTVHGNVVAAQTVSNSFKSINKLDDNAQLSETFRMLEESVKALVEGLDNKNDANSVARDVKGFCEEVNSELPRENTLKHYLGNIGEVAVKAGALGVKVVNVISTLSPLIKVLTEHASN